MKTVSMDKNWLLGNIQAHVEPQPIPIVKRILERNNSKSDKLKLNLVETMIKAGQKHINIRWYYLRTENQRSS